jgi:germination protein M
VPTPNTRAGMRSLSALSLLLLVLAAGCAGEDDSAGTTAAGTTVTETGTPSIPTETAKALTIYLLRDGKVTPVSRTVVTGRGVGAAALRELLKGPSADDEGLETAIPSGTALRSLAIQGGVASVELSRPLPQDDALAQVVYTLTRFPTVKRVDVGADTPVGRRAFENQTPAILVESPLPGETVKPSFAVKGTANTFEATFNYELWASGTVLAKDFVTATSGSGTRGTFAFKVGYEVDEPTDGKLVVFELSAEDGSRIHQQEIPLRLE